MTPDTQNSTTKYTVLVDMVRGQIEAGALRPGDQLPSFGEMRAKHGFSRATVERALGILERDGLVTRVNGSGIFVKEPEILAPAEPLGRQLGLILPNCRTGFFSQIIEGVEKESRAAGYDLVVANSRGDVNLQSQLLLQLSARTAGLCIMPCHGGHPTVFNTLVERGTPVVLLDRRLDGLDVPLVATDNERGGYLATKHLLDLGCERVYVISRPLEQASSLRDRVSGSKRALGEAGIAFEPSRLVREGDDWPARMGYLSTRELLDEVESEGLGVARIGIFPLNEEIARGVYLALKERGWRIPQDVSVVSFDGTVANLFDPPLTAVRQDMIGIGREGVVRLLQLIRGAGLHQVEDVQLQPELIVRNSSDPESRFCTVSQLLQGPRGPEQAMEMFSAIAGM